MTTVRKAIISVALIATIAIVIFQMYELGVTTANDSVGEVVVEIPKGATARKVAAILKENGVLEDAFLFEAEARITGDAKKLRSGEYRLKKNLSVRETLSTLVEGKTILYRVTIPEGLTIKEVGALLEEKGIALKEKFIEAASDPDIISQRNIPATSLEGYLFPETYNFPKNTTEPEIVEAMVMAFFSAVQKAGINPEGDPAKLLRLVTLASLIEKETSVDSEREVVSSVYTNRLRIGMLLQCDPTVIYALPAFDGNIRRKDLSYDSPYNTYRYPGLPPGPIANPGVASLKAAENPAKTPYFYFVATGGKDHVFSRTLAEHNRAVRKYQLRGRKK